MVLGTLLAWDVKIQFVYSLRDHSDTSVRSVIYD